MGTTDQTLVKALVGRRKDGSPQFENLWVEGRPDGLYTLVRSPLLALGIARGDTFELNADNVITRVVAHGGFHAVQFVAVQTMDDLLIHELSTLAEQLGGTFDAHDDLMAALSIPGNIPPQDILQAVAAFREDHPVDDWWVGSAAELAR